MSADNYEFRDGVPYLVKPPMSAREAMDESRPLPELAQWVLSQPFSDDPPNARSFAQMFLALYDDVDALRSAYVRGDITLAEFEDRVGEIVLREDD